MAKQKNRADSGATVRMRARTTFRNNAHEGTVRRGATFETTAERAAALARAGNAEPLDAYDMPGPSVTKPDAPSERKAAKPKHVGGGWYELPSGEKVQGKDAALEAMKA